MLPRLALQLLVLRSRLSNLRSLPISPFLESRLSLLQARLHSAQHPRPLSGWACTPPPTSFIASPMFDPPFLMPTSGRAGMVAAPVPTEMLVRPSLNRPLSMPTCGRAGMVAPGRFTGQYHGRDVRTPSPLPRRGRFLKCTKTEEFFKKSNTTCHIHQVRQGKCGCAVVVGGGRGNRSEVNPAPKWQQSVPGSSRV